MNIVQIISNKEWGGGETYVLHLSQALRQAGHNVVVVCRRVPAVIERFKAAGFEPVVMHLGGPFDIMTPIRLGRIVRRFGDGETVNIHVHNFKDAATALRVKALNRDRDVNIVCTRHLVQPSKAKHQTLYNALDHIVFVSERARSEFVSGSARVEPQRLSVIHNALPPQADSQAATANVADDGCKLIYLGRLAAEKGTDVLVDAAKQLRGDWHLTIYGTGEGKFVMPLLRDCRQEPLSTHVDWPGHVDNTARVMAGADIGIVPTVVPEAFGLSLLEMMQHGLAVVTTDNGAQPEIITHEVDGLLVPPGDSGALAAAVQRLIDDAPLRRALGQAARRTAAERFGYHDFVRKIINLYR